MKIKLAALTLLCVAMICSESNADLLGRMLGKSGCGECEAAPTCCETPDPCCGRGISISLHIGLPGRLFKGCGCKPECEEQVVDACDDGCGGGRVKAMFAKVFNGCCKEDACAEPEPACEEADDCGCKLFSRGLFSRCCDSGCEEEEPACEDACGSGMNLDLRGRVSGLVSRIGSMGGNSCGCEEAPAAEPAPACEDSCGCGMNLDLRGRVSGLVSRVGSMGCNSCGCEEAPAAEPAPACEDSCGCGMNLDLRGRVSGLVSRVGSMGSNACGCEEAPATDCESDCGCGRPAVVKNIVARMPRPGQNCGCEETPACDDPCKANLLDRIRQVGNRCNDGCRVFQNSGCSDCETADEEAAGDDQAAKGIKVDPSLFMSFRG